MYLLNLSIKNIKRNFHNYVIYLFSLSFIIMVYFLFCSTYYNENILSSMEFLNEASPMFKFSNSVLLFFCVLFVWYCNSFFTKNRSKEFALYSVLGVKKKEISLILLIETLAIGLLALTLGIFIGSLFLKLLLMLLLKLTGFKTNLVMVSFSYLVIKDTVKTFIIIFIILSIRNFIYLKRLKLINMFKVNNALEKEPNASFIFAILSLFLIVEGYNLALFSDKSRYLSNSLYALTMITLGTYGLFSSFFVFIIKISKKNKHYYYKGINMLGVSEILYRMKKNSKTLATVSILIAGTIITLTMAYSYYYFNETVTPRKEPFSFSYISDEKAFDKAIKDVISNYPDNKLLKETEAFFIRVNGSIPNMDKVFPDSDIKRFSVMPESEYVKLANTLGIRISKSISSPKEVILLNGEFNKKTMDNYIGKNITIENIESPFEVIDFIPENLINNSLISIMVVVDNNLYSSLSSKEKLYRFKGFLVENPKNSEQLNTEISETFKRIIKENSISEPNEKNFIENNLSTFYTQYNNYLQSSGLLAYIGTFLGLVFLICTASIIFFKQLSDATEDKINYDLLRDIGASSKEIKSSINKQILILFLSPLAVGIFHAYVVLYLLSHFLGENFQVPITVTTSVYTLIYLIYCRITVNAYYKIINS